MNAKITQSKCWIWLQPVKGRHLVGVRVVALCVLLIAGCNSFELKSRWRTQAVTIDGQNTEWQSAMTQIEGKQAMVGILNDSTYIYLCLVTSDQGLQRQVMFRGLMVWFDHEGGEEKRFGIHFPVGMQMGGFPRPMRDSDEGGKPDEQPRERTPLDTSNAEIIGPMEGEHRAVNLIELKGIAVKASVSNGTLVYELRVPLMDAGGEPYGIGTKIGAAIGIGMETGVRREPQVPNESGDTPGGGMGRGGGRRGRGGFGGGRGGDGGDRPGRSGQQAEPLKVWAKVQLATPESGG